ncbi:hypothetical protein ACFWN2_01070 [Lentzea sp. NPDC058436]|uniref:hypothetical protein n=1 Tax=Lentzea sp. NPDC058436 TaxID=3346499 RepID=UPI0036560B8C
MDHADDREQDALPSVSNTVSGAVTGNVTQIGSITGNVHFGDVHVWQGEPARSRYREVVRRLAPATLADREAELAELAGFCTAEVTPTAFRWWRAPAWAGKSALMATFVLAPPPGVRIVSFFVTARLAGQSDRSAFLDSTLEQLAALLGRGTPPPVNREAHFLGLFTEAARWCADQGERLVLLVDGLDEDRGVTGTDFHSIAALLPPEPPHGARMIVSGRPHPPVPDDVPDAHPLRDPEIVRTLAPSERARVVAMDMRRELDRLISGPQVDQDLVGLLVASGGGLTAADFAELIADPGWPSWRVQEHLHSVAGRSFAPLAGAYLLGHEELAVTAAARVGEQRLSAYRNRLHAWADTYRERGWPAETPVHLLQAYHRVLLGAQDVERLVGLVSDRARHERMAETFGGHHSAITEITAAQRLLLSGDPVDLPAMVLLNVRRHFLASQDATIPHTLPMAWAAVGEVDRARSLARSMTEDWERQVTLVEVATVLGVEHPRCSQLLDDVEQIAAEGGEHSTVQLVGVLASWGFLDRARVLVRSLIAEHDVETQLVQLVRAMTRAGDLDQAESLLELVGTSVPRPELPRISLLKHPPTREQVKAGLLADLVVALVRRGELDRARAISARIGDPLHRRLAVAVLIGASPPEEGGRLHDEAQTTQDDSDPARARAGAVVCTAATGAYDLAVSQWKELPAPLQAEVHTALIDQCPTHVAVELALEADALHTGALLARIGSTLEPGLELAWVAETALEHLSNDFARMSPRAQYGLRDLLPLFERTGPHSMAELEDIVDCMPDVEVRHDVFALLAEAAVRRGDLTDARRLLLELVELFTVDQVLESSIPDLPPHADFDEAEELVRSLEEIAYPLAGLAVSAARAGHTDRARRLATAAEDVVRTRRARPLYRWLSYLVPTIRSRRRAALVAEHAIAALAAQTTVDFVQENATASRLIDATRALGRPDLTARVLHALGDPLDAPDLFTVALHRIGARLRRSRPSIAPVPARQIAERLLEDEWTEHIASIAALHPDLPERVHDLVLDLAESR